MNSLGSGLAKRLLKRLSLIPGLAQWPSKLRMLVLGLWVTALAATLTVTLTATGTTVVHAKEAPAATPTILLRDLPPQGQAVMTLIYQGGPFRYEKDGTVFGNREKLLPLRQRGYYREYTVLTPGERSRGARRIVCGGLKPTQPNACFYTADHYASFRQIVH